MKNFIRHKKFELMSLDKRCKNIDVNDLHNQLGLAAAGINWHLRAVRDYLDAPLLRGQLIHALGAKVMPGLDRSAAVSR